MAQESITTGDWITWGIAGVAALSSISFGAMQRLDKKRDRRERQRAQETRMEVKLLSELIGTGISVVVTAKNLSTYDVVVRRVTIEAMDSPSTWSWHEGGIVPSGAGIPGPGFGGLHQHRL